MTAGIELHLADAELSLAGADDPAFAALGAEYADVLGVAPPPPGLPPKRCMELVIETGDSPMPRSRPVKRLSEAEAGGVARADHRPPRLLLDPALDGRIRDVSGVRAEA